MNLARIAPAGISGLLLRVYLPFAGAYFLSYLYRTVNAVVGPLIAADLDLSASDLGLLTAAYFVMFAAVQLPLGVALDHYGPRRVQTTLLLIAALGATLFGLGSTMTELALGRMLIGLGVAAGLMGALKVITLWFPPPQWPLVNGLLLAAGGLGSLMATAPSQAALRIMSWHSLFFWLSAITVVVAGLVWLVVPEKPTSAQRDTLRMQIRAVGQIIRDRFFLRMLPVLTVMQASFIGIQTLWISPWLRDVAGQDADARARTMLLVALIMTIGFLTSGMTSGLARRVGISIMATAHLAFVFFWLCVIALAAASLGLGPPLPPLALWAGFAFFGTYSVLYLPVLTAAFPVALSGRVNTSANFIVFSSVFLVQWGVGRLLDVWPRTAAGGYAPRGYATAFAIVIVAQVLAMLWQRTFRARPLSEASAG